MSPGALDFTIIVPVFNRADAIEACVRSLYAVEYDPTRFEVLVVDNGSTDESARVALQAGARVLSVSRPNRSLARNEGARVARGGWLAFTDSDCVIDRGWLKAFAEAAGAYDGAPGRESPAVLAGEILNGGCASPVEAYIAERRWLDQAKFLAGRRFAPPFAATANLAVRADAFERVGGFDPQMPPAEDADWCWRAAEEGCAIRYVPAALVRHHHRATLTGMLRQAYGYGLGNARLFCKHRRRWGARAWIEWNWWVWAIKGLARSPWDALTGATPLDKRLGWYDFLANGAQALGRLRGGWEGGVLIV